MRYLWVSKITLVSIGLKSTEKRFILALILFPDCIKLIEYFVSAVNW